MKQERACFGDPETESMLGKLLETIVWPILMSGLGDAAGNDAERGVLARMLVLRACFMFSDQQLRFFVSDSRLIGQFVEKDSVSDSVLARIVNTACASDDCTNQTRKWIDAMVASIMTKDVEQGSARLDFSGLPIDENLGISQKLAFLMPQIERLRKAGVGHSMIRQRLNDGGVEVSEQTYLKTLYRLQKRKRKKGAVRHEPDLAAMPDRQGKAVDPSARRNEIDTPPKKFVYDNSPIKWS